MEEVKMKDSNVKWIGQLPEDWNLYRIKELSQLKSGGTPEGNEGIVSEEENNIRWYTAPDFNDTNLELSSSERSITKEAVQQNSYKLFTAHSTLMVAIASIGKIGITNTDCYSNQQITAIMPKEKKVFPKFITYGLLAAMDFIKDTALYTTVPIVNSLFIGNIKIPYPIISEQKRIAEFLDKKCSEIDEVISKTEEQISTLENYKNSLITETVTRGLRKIIEYKDSNIKWIGKIPANWQILKLKYLARNSKSLFIDGDWIESDIIEEQGIRYLTTGNVGCGFYKEQGNGYISEENFKKLNCLKILPNDLLICRLNEPIGRACIAPNIEKKYVVAVDVAVLRPDKEHDKKYLMYCMNTSGYADLGKELARGSTMQRVSRTLLGQLKLPIPPLNEQIEISSFLDKKCEKIDKIVTQQKESLETLKKYKKSLIYEYVTGKKRV